VKPVGTGSPGEARGGIRVTPPFAQIILIIGCIISHMFEKLKPKKDIHDKFIDPKKNPLSESNIHLVKEIMVFSFDDELTKYTIYLENLVKKTPDNKHIQKEESINEKNSINPKYELAFDPDNPHKDPLVLLMSYCFVNIYYRVESNRIATNHLIMELEFLPIPLLIRSTLELWASISRIEQEIKIFIESKRTPNDIERISAFSIKMAYGMKFHPEIDGKQFPIKVDAINVITLIEQLNKRFPQKNILTAYNYLCEYCHPNTVLPLYSYTMMEMNRIVKLSDSLKIDFDSRFNLFFEYHLLILLDSLEGVKESMGVINDLMIDEF
jgi:hypothetical protein